MQKYSDNQVVELTRKWVETIVVGLNLCPFAAPVVKDNSLRYSVARAENADLLASNFLSEIETVMAAAEGEIATSLFIVPEGLEDFGDYLDLLSLFEELLEEAGLAGILQLASFHPQYLFDGVAEDDLSHWTNRSPWPMFHIIREAQMSRALTQYKNPEDIPERNIALLREMGRDELIKRFPPFADYC